MALEDRGGSPVAGGPSVATTAYVDAADNLKAPLASPAFTGVPTAPTAAAGTNTTQIATTAFVELERGELPLYATLQAASAAVVAGTHPDGALFAVAQHSPTGTSVLRASVWRVRVVDTNSPYATPEYAMQGTSGIVAQLSSLFSGTTVPGLALSTMGGLLVTDESSAISYRWVGAGKTTLGSGNTTALFQAWSKPPVSFTPSWSAGITVGNSTQVAWWGISDGRLWVDLNFVGGSTYALTNSWQTLVLPSAVVGQVSAGTGQFQPAGNSASGTMLGLVAFTIANPAGTSSTGVRVGTYYLNSAFTPPGIPRLANLSAAGLGAVGDNFSLSISAPSMVAA